MRIFIDGDGSPVKKDTIAIAGEFGLEVTIVTSVDHYSLTELPDYVKMVYVDKGADSADFRIVALISTGDILVTQDYGLASLVLPKGAIVIHQTGFIYDNSNMNNLLESRYMGQMIRKSGKRTKGPKKFTEQNHLDFQNKLREILTK
jgi:uncharacterized protein YaiI (UPF0178 family)